MKSRPTWFARCDKKQLNLIKKIKQQQINLHVKPHRRYVRSHVSKRAVLKIVPIGKQLRRIDKERVNHVRKSHPNDRILNLAPLESNPGNVFHEDPAATKIQIVEFKKTVPSIDSLDMNERHRGNRTIISSHGEIERSDTDPHSLLDHKRLIQINHSSRVFSIMSPNHHEIPTGNLSTSRIQIIWNGNKADGQLRYPALIEQKIERSGVERNRNGQRTKERPHILAKIFDELILQNRRKKQEIVSSDNTPQDMVMRRFQNIHGQKRAAAKNT